MKRFCATLILVVACRALAAQAAPAQVQTVASSRLVAAARAALPTTRQGLKVSLHVIGAPSDTTVPVGTVRLQTHPLVGRWPRARAAVPVVIRVNGKPVRTETIWFAVKALCQGWVYGQDAPAGTPIGKLKLHKETVNVADAEGEPVAKPSVLANERLRRGVRAGWPVLASDFKPIPDVDKGDQVAVHVRYGPIRMETRGKALGSGDVGDVVQVLVQGGSSPVSAKVAGKGEVKIAHQ